MATEMLKQLQLRKLPVTLKTMVDLLVNMRHCEVYVVVLTPSLPSPSFPLQLLPSIQNECPDIRDMALNCLGLACLLDISLARNHILLFLQV